MVVVIVSSARDSTANLLSKAMHRESIDCARIDLDEDSIPMVALESQDGDLQATVATKNRSIDAREVRNIIFRKPVRPRFPNYESAEEAFLAREAEAGLRAFLATCDCEWINHPQAIRQASSKMMNLQLAATFGLQTPATIVSSEPSRIAEWISKTGDAVIKACSYGLIEDEDQYRMVFSQSLPRDFQPKKDIEFGVPVLLQQRVPAKTDVRVTVVGAKVFAAEVNTMELDWREAPQELPWRATELPADILDSLRRMVRAMDLKFAAIDMLRNAEGWWFLELNPNGQWAWLEQEAEIPISNAFCALIEDLS